MWFKAHTVQDNEGHFDEVDVLYQYYPSEDGPEVKITAYVVPVDYWCEETVRFNSLGTALDYVSKSTSIMAVDWLDRIIELEGIP